MDAVQVTIIIPVYNVEAYIERCARSLYEQSYEHIEYIWVNDFTPDRSIDILKEITDEYPERASSVKIIEHSENLGAVVARQTGITASTGKYIFKFDSDDWADNEMIKELVVCAELEQSDIVWCDYYISYSDKEILVKQSFQPSKEKCIQNLLSERMHGGCMNKLVKSSLYKENQIKLSPQASMCEDLRESIQLFYYAQKVCYYPRAFYHYEHENIYSQSRLFSPTELDRILLNIDGIWDFLIEKNIVDEYKRELNYLKLLGKRSLLASSDLSHFKLWNRIYPDSSKYILSYTVLPLSLRLVGFCASYKLWALLFVWIKMKKIKLKIYASR